MPLGIPSLSGITRQLPWNGGGNKKPPPSPRPKPAPVQTFTRTPSAIAAQTAADARRAQLQRDAAMRTGLDMGNTLAAGQFGALANERGQMEQKIGLFEGNEKTQGGYMAQELDAQRAHLLNKEAGLGLERTNQANDLGLAEALGGLAQQGFNVDDRGNRQSAAIDDRMLGSKGTFKDSYTSEFSRLGFKDIQDKLANQLENTGIGRKESDARLKAKRAEVANANKAIDIRANELGLDRKDFERAFQQGLEKLHLDTVLSVADVMMAIEGNDFTKSQLGEQIYRQALADAPFNMTRTYSSGELLAGKNLKPDPVYRTKGGVLAQ